jgi:predicted amidohydrolase YtcJ
MGARARILRRSSEGWLDENASGRACGLFFLLRALADTLIENVNGYTIDRQGKRVRFAAMLVADDGRVRQLYARGERRAERPQYRLDGRGRTLIPGLFDAHGHVMGLGMGSSSST